jgi:hypothetical protein
VIDMSPFVPVAIFSCLLCDPFASISVSLLFLLAAFLLYCVYLTHPTKIEIIYNNMAFLRVQMMK